MENFRGLSKTKRLKEAKRRIDEASALNLKTLDLSNLALNDNDLKTLDLKEKYWSEEEFESLTQRFKDFGNSGILKENSESISSKPFFWVSLNLSNNNFKSIDSLPKAMNIYLINNPKLKILKLKYKVFNLYIDNTSIDSYENLKEFIEEHFTFSNTPLEKKLIPRREVDKSRVLKLKDSHNLPYEIYTIPKGTVLFRNFETLQDLPSVYVGYKNLVNTQDLKYYLLPDQITFFFTSPQTITKHAFGEIKTLFVLQNDIQVLLGFKPASRIKETSITDSTKFQSQETLFFETCKTGNKDIMKNQEHKGYTCLRSEFKEKNIAGFFVNWWDASNSSIGVSPSKVEDLEFLPEYETFHNQFFIPELAIYPKNKREFEDIVTPIEEFNESWMYKHLPEFNYKPLYIFNEDGVSEQSSKNYKDTFLQLLSPEGMTFEEVSYHITINKTDGTYVLAELASEETLNNCLELSEDKTHYLKEFLKIINL